MLVLDLSFVSYGSLESLVLSLVPRKEVNRVGAANLEYRIIFEGVRHFVEALETVLIPFHPRKHECWRRQRHDYFR